MRYFLSLGLMLLAIKGYSAAEAGAGAPTSTKVTSGSGASFTSMEFVSDKRHKVVKNIMTDKSLADLLHPTTTGFGRSSDRYTQIIPPFIGEAVKGGHFLDLGCGRAAHAVPVFNSRTAPVHYTAVDLDATQAETVFTAKPLAFPPSKDRSTISFISSDAITHLKTLASGSVDGVLSAHLVHFLMPAQLLEFYREVNRVLKSGHRLYLTWGDYNAGQNGELTTAYESQLGKFWPGLNINGTLIADAIRTSLCEAFTDAELEAEVDKAVRAHLSASSKYTPESVTAGVLTTLRTKRPATNILKPMEMAGLLEDLGFEVMTSKADHYMDGDLVGYANSYYGLIVRKISDKFNKDKLALRLAEAEGTLRLIGDSSTIKPDRKTDILKTYVAKQLAKLG